MILHMRHTLWTGISETNVNIITSATRPHAFNKKIKNKYIYIYMDHPPYNMHYSHPPVDDLTFKIEYNHTPRLVNVIIIGDDA